MLISPSIVDLTKGKYNAYTIVIAAAKGARMVTDEYVAARACRPYDCKQGNG